MALLLCLLYIKIEMCYFCLEICIYLNKGFMGQLFQACFIFALHHIYFVPILSNMCLNQLPESLHFLTTGKQGDHYISGIREQIPCIIHSLNDFVLEKLYCRNSMICVTIFGPLL